MSLKSPCFRFLVLAIAVLTAGVVRGVGVGSGSVSTFLVALHLHGSMSEGYGTMTNHIEQAELAGFDGMWFTDHMGRQDTWAYPLVASLDGSLLGANLPAPISAHSCELTVQGQDPNLLTLSFSSTSPMVGSENLSVTASADSVTGSGYKWATLSFHGHDRAHRLPLLAEPQFAGWVRLRSQTGDAGFAIRLSLSGVADGTDSGELRILELVPANFLGTVPPPKLGVVRLQAPSLPLNQWIHLSAEPHQYVSMFPGGTLDMAILEAEIVFYARNSGEVRVDIDHISMSRLGPTGAAIFAEARTLLDSFPSSPVFTKVGAEVEGPWDQAVMSISSRDHMLALFPTTTPAHFPFTAGTPSAINYPQSGVDLIHQNGGIAILAHIFGANQSPNFNRAGGLANQLANRIYQNAAWGADGLEVGYPHRCRPMADAIMVWDQLSENQVYITGIGSSDLHEMIDWPNWPNRWGTWIIASDDSNQSLIDAVKAGDCFFGDPFRLDPTGFVTIEHNGGNYTMGDVVPLASGTQNFRIDVQGSLSTGDVVLLVNGVEVDRRAISVSGSQTYVQQEFVAPGSWIRVELRDQQDRPYAMTNPIYFIGPGQTPPAHRAP